MSKRISFCFFMIMNMILYSEEGSTYFKFLEKHSVKENVWRHETDTVNWERKTLYNKNVLELVLYRMTTSSENPWKWTLTPLCSWYTWIVNSGSCRWKRNVQGYGKQVLFTVFWWRNVLEQSCYKINKGLFVGSFGLVYWCCPHLEHRASVKIFVSLQFFLI
jgi:hypothetical protein